jgi:hypothetical protein
MAQLNCLTRMHTDRSTDQKRKETCFRKAMRGSSTTPLKRFRSG